jgi:hypothetical protein
MPSKHRSRTKVCATRFARSTTIAPADRALPFFILTPIVSANGKFFMLCLRNLYDISQCCSRRNYGNWVDFSMRQALPSSASEEFHQSALSKIKFGQYATPSVGASDLNFVCRALLARQPLRRDRAQLLNIRRGKHEMSSLQIHI